MPDDNQNSRSENNDTLTPMSLANRACESCHSSSPKVAESEYSGLLTVLPEWEVHNTDEMRQLKRCFDFNDYLRGLLFVNQLGELAESVNHHPTILVEWRKVTIRWWTHTINGLHQNDFILAARTDLLYNSIISESL